ncbi:hypothetical protein Pen01_12550 [Phytomonospora endophytica]|nr:hypothetical protein Pen01_12550 [Phytomonospora endophytica]
MDRAAQPKERAMPVRSAPRPFTSTSKGPGICALGFFAADFAGRRRAAVVPVRRRAGAVRLVAVFFRVVLLRPAMPLPYR